MADYYLYVGLTISFVCLLLYYLNRSPKKNHPPGPKPWPLFGNLFNLPRPLFLAASGPLKKLHGDVISFTFGSRRFVILNSYSVIKEALTGPYADVFSGRNNTELVQKLIGGKGIVSAEGRLWKEHRRFALKVLRDFGFARTGTEEAIHVEVEELRRKFDEDQDNHGFETADLIGRCIANVISVMLFNYRAGYDDEKFDDFLHATQENLQSNNIARFIPNAFPILLKYPLTLKILQMLGFDVNLLERNVKVTQGFCIEQIKRHRATLDQVNEPRDYLDAFLLEKEKLERQAPNSEHTFDDTQLVRSLTELFIAGTDTTANTLRWGLLYAALHPDCQDKIYEEIKVHVGDSRLPNGNDKKNLQYLLAYIDEVQRYSTLAPFSVQHRCLHDIKFKGYDITSSDLIMVNLFGVHHDPELWEEPETFKPERFLTSENGTLTYKPNDYLVPFSLGKRACLGESLARQELLLFLSGIFQKYKIELVPVENIEQVLIGSTGLVHAPGKHNIRFVKRDNL